MDENKYVSRRHEQTRTLLRVLGIVFLLVGGGFVLLGLIDFFSAFGEFGRRPTKFHYLFIGMPLGFVGLVLLQYGFVGAVLKYQAREVAPVGKDTFNYLAKGTRDGVRDIASAVGEGLSEGDRGDATVHVRCPSCNALLDEDARFCDQCGETVQKTVTCVECGELNDSDAKFCDNCGTRLA
jgi:RNA polymerase subunit RPABC4/transcription elongation factor Spt4